MCAVNNEINFRHALELAWPAQGVQFTKLGTEVHCRRFPQEFLISTDLKD